MKINPINENYSVNFNAEIMKTTSMEKFYNTLYSRNGSPHINLWNYVKSAVANHPSNSKIYTRVNFFNDGSKRSRAALSNLSDVYLDDSIKPSQYLNVWSAWVNILDPKNKDQFHKLFGKKYASVYDEWWNKNLMPVWKLLSALR